MDLEIKELIEEGVPFEEIAEKYSGEECVTNYNIKMSENCHEDADCNDCWIKCLEKSISV